MMIDFPDSPTQGDEFTVGALTWFFDDPVWRLKSGSGGGGGGGGGSDGYSFVQDTPPTATAAGQTWFDTASGDSFVWFVDADGGQWVQDTGGGGGTVTGEPPAFAYGKIEFNGQNNLDPAEVPVHAVIREFQTTGGIEVATNGTDLKVTEAGWYRVHAEAQLRGADPNPGLYTVLTIDPVDAAGASKSAGTQAIAGGVSFWKQVFAEHTFQLAAGEGIRFVLSSNQALNAEMGRSRFQIQRVDAPIGSGGGGGASPPADGLALTANVYGPTPWALPASGRQIVPFDTIPENPLVEFANPNVTPGVLKMKVGGLFYVTFGSWGLEPQPYVRIRKASNNQQIGAGANGGGVMMWTFAAGDELFYEIDAVAGYVTNDIGMMFTDMRRTV